MKKKRIYVNGILIGSIIMSLNGSNAYGKRLNLVANKTYENKTLSESFIEEDKNNIDYDIENNNIYIYDNKILKQLLEYDNPTPDDLTLIINTNEKIDNKYKPYLEEYIKLLKNKYPNINLQAFAENLKLLKIIEVPRKTMDLFASESTNAYFKPDSNKIVLLDSYKNEAEFKQCFYHECTHMLNCIYMPYGNYNIVKNFTIDDGEGIALEEAVTSYITDNIYDDESYKIEKNQTKIFMNSFNNQEAFIDMYINSNITKMKYYLMQNGNTIEQLDNLFTNMEEQKIKVNSKNCYDKKEYLNTYEDIIDCCFNAKISDFQNHDVENMNDFAQTEIMNLKNKILANINTLSTGYMKEEIIDILNERTDLYLEQYTEKSKTKNIT